MGKKKAPRKKAGGRLLSWHKGVKQWYKTVPIFEDGHEATKRKYFGTGRGVSDLTSYRRALVKYQAYMDEWEIGQAARAHLKRMASREMGTTVIEQWLQKHRRHVYDPDHDLTAEEETERRQQNSLKLRGLTAKSNETDPVSSGGVTISDHIDRWLKMEQSRRDARQITPAAWDSKRKGIKTFRELCAGRSLGSPQDVERLLGDYRVSLLACFEVGTYAANTVNDKLKFLGQFVRWAYENRVLDESPRTLKTILIKLPVMKEGHPLALPTIRDTWSSANPRMKCFIALGLNCGFKNKDIAVLRAEDVRGNRIVSTRSKTKAPMNYLLWGVTQRLINQTRQDAGQGAGGALFSATNGSPIAPGTIGALFKKVAKVAGAEVGKTKHNNTAYATFEQLRDTSTQQVQMSLTQQGKDQSILQLFLAHKDSSTAAYYTTNDPLHFNSAALDQEIKKLEHYFDLSETDSATA